MNRLRTVWSVLSAAALVMAAGACGSDAGGPLDASATGGSESGAQASVSPKPSPSPSATPTPGPTPTPAPTPSPTPTPSPGGDDNGADVEFRGAIQSVSAPNLTVAGRLVRTSGSTEILDDRNNPIAFSGLRAGLVVEVEGHTQTDGSVAAKKIKIED